MSIAILSKKIHFGISQIARFGNYSIKILTRSHLDKAIQILTQQFNKKQPLTIAYYKKFPQKRKKSLQNWREYWSNFCPIFFENNLSVGCFDLQNNDQLVGTLLGKDIKFQIEYFKIIQKDHFKYPNIFMSKQLSKSIVPQYKNQFLNNSSNFILQTSTASLKDSHMGKNLLIKMMRCSEYLGYINQYKYIYTWTSNIKSAKAVEKLNYQKISEINAKKFSLQGIQYFQKIDGDNQLQALWIKEIQNLGGNQIPLNL